jgi:hypothetical protein
MKKSSRTFEALIGKFPNEREAVERLARLVDSPTAREMTFDHLQLLVRASAPETLAGMLTELTRIGILRRVVRVESRSHGGIQDFESATEVPDRIFDWHIDEEIKVTPDLLRVVYQAGAYN